MILERVNREKRGGPVLDKEDHDSGAFEQYVDYCHR